MATKGAIFTLSVRDERFDKFFTASDYLRKRLDAIRIARAALGEPNLQPTFADIEKTHIMHVHQTYRPFVAVASEYSKVRPSGDGNASLGLSGGSLQFHLPIHGHFTSDMALHISIGPVGTKSPILVPTPTEPGVAQKKTSGAAAAAVPSPLFAYTAYPGVRIVQKAQFTSGEILVSEYKRDEVSMWSKFFVLNNYEVEFDRCMGQQQLRRAEFFNSNGFTQSMDFYDGPQTPKFFQERLDLWIPLQFDFCREPSHALLNDLIPNTQRVVNIELAPLTQIIEAFAQSGDPDTLPDVTDLPFSSLKIESTLYANNLYVNPEIHDVFASRIGFHMFRLWRSQTIPLEKPSGRVLVDQLKFPAEFLMMGIRDKANAQDFNNWYLMGRAKPRTNMNSLLFPAAVWNPSVLPSGMPQIVVRTGFEASTFDPIIDTIGVTAHGITLLPESQINLFSAYLPFRYNLTNPIIAAPEDTSCFLIPFCLFPGQSTLSGYYNLSTGRELYVSYTGKQISPTAPGELFIMMSALNFILRKGDTISLRFAI